MLARKGAGAQAAEGLGEQNRQASAVFLPKMASCPLAVLHWLTDGSVLLGRRKQV